MTLSLDRYFFDDLAQEYEGEQQPKPQRRIGPPSARRIWQIRQRLNRALHSLMAGGANLEHVLQLCQSAIRAANAMPSCAGRDRLRGEAAEVLYFVALELEGA